MRVFGVVHKVIVRHSMERLRVYMVGLIYNAEDHRVGVQYDLDVVGIVGLALILDQEPDMIDIQVGDIIEWDG